MTLRTPFWVNLPHVTILTLIESAGALYPSKGPFTGSGNEDFVSLGVIFQLTSPPTSGTQDAELPVCLCLTISGRPQGGFPAEYVMDEEGQGHLTCLDNNHSHFILVDDGTHGHYGVEIPLRTRLEKFISEQTKERGGERSLLLRERPAAQGAWGTAGRDQDVQQAGRSATFAHPVSPVEGAPPFLLSLRA